MTGAPQDKPKSASRFPFIHHLGLRMREHGEGTSTWSVTIVPEHHNGNGVVHGGVLFSLADTGMGSALHGALEPGQACATVELKINYFKPVRGGEVLCTSRVVHRARTLAHLESDLTVDGVLVARANAHFAIFPRKTA